MTPNFGRNWARNPSERAREKAKERLKKYLPTRQAAKQLGIAADTLRKWARKGAPHQKGPRGYYRFDVTDVKNWLKGIRAKAPSQKSLIGASLQKRAPIEESAAYLQEVRDVLGLTLSEFAKHLGISRAVLVQYMYPRIGRHSVPSEILSKAEFLSKSLEPKRHPQAKISEDEVIEALRRANGVKHQAKKLLGCSARTLNDLIEEYELEDFVKPKDYAERFTKKQLVAALNQAKGNKSAAARILGISRHTMLKLIDEAGLSGQYSFGYSENQIRDALTQASGSRRDAAKILGTSSSTVTAAIKRFGLQDEFPAPRKMPPPTTVRHILDEMEWNLPAVAVRLGVSHSYLHRYLRKHSIVQRNPFLFPSWRGRIRLKRRRKRRF